MALHEFHIRFSTMMHLKNTVLLLGHVQAHTGAKRFATVSGLNDMFPGNSVQRCATGFEIRFLSFGGCIKNVIPISSNVYINHVVLKRPLVQWFQVKSFTMCPLQLVIRNN